MAYEMNMKRLKRYRKKLLPGDIFVLQIQEATFHFGRIVATNCRVRVAEGGILIYVYNTSSSDKTDIPSLSKHDLLMPPTMTSREPWTHGYFNVVASRHFEEGDLWTPHCFLSRWDNRYYDEYNHQLPERREPCGHYSWSTIMGLDKGVSRALGIPISPDDSG